MVILALDTTSRSGSLSLAREEKILETVPLEASEGFGHILYQQILALLARHHLALSQVDCYAAASGPGSFTGIRVGLTAVKALAEVHAKKIVPVSNLLALASLGRGRYRAPLIDARRGEVYGAVYDERLRSVLPEVVAPWKDFLKLVAGHPVTFVAREASLFEPGGAAELGPEQAGDQHFMTVTTPLAEAVARVAAARCDSADALPPEAVDANYVRRPDAELNWKEPE